MHKTYRPWDPRKTFLFPPSMTDWLDDDHLAFTILDIVGQLDLSAIHDKLQAKDPRGERPYDPRMMVALLLYGYCVGEFSSRRIAAATWNDLAFRVVAGDEHPHFSTICLFRQHHLDVFEGLFVQVLKICQRAGMVKMGHIALDGTKIQANASKHQAMSHARMKETEARLKAEVEALMARAQATDRAEDAVHGADKDGTELPEELRRREDRLKRIVAAREALEAEARAARALELTEQARAAAERAARETDEREAERLRRQSAARQQSADALQADPTVLPGSGDDRPFNKPPHDASGAPKANTQRNFTDPESRIMESGGAYLQGYNGQIAVDEHAGIIVAQTVTNQAADVEHLPWMLDQIIENTSTKPDHLTADAGYWSTNNGENCERNGVDAYLSTRRHRHHEVPNAPPSADLPPSSTPKEKMTQKISSKEGSKIYAKRKWVVEPQFGYIKEVRGFRRFSLRGLQKVRGEWSLVTLCHNVLKYHRNG